MMRTIHMRQNDRAALMNTFRLTTADSVSDVYFVIPIASGFFINHGAVCYTVEYTEVEGRRNDVLHLLPYPGLVMGQR